MTRQAMLIGSLIGVAACLLSGCEEPPERAGLPACEPPNELRLERGLKEGFRAVAEGRWQAAEDAFERVLDTEPGHPEARAGLRMSVKMTKSLGGLRATRGLILNEHELATKISIDHASLRLEARAAERRLAERIPTEAMAASDTFKPRRPDGKSSLSGIDLVVLHRTDTLDALEGFVHLTHSAKSAHLMIDWDGSVYQTLDLDLIAEHTGHPHLDARSIAISLVAPADAASPPLPKHAKKTERPMSQRVRIHGKLTRSWGYTEAQVESLRSLLSDLGRLLPDFEVRAPGAGNVPLNALSPAEQRSATGIVGLLHLDPKSTDPGPGFDWSSLK